MKITYDEEADAAYIYLADESEGMSGWVKTTYMCDEKRVGGMINLDFDKEGKLCGIEVLDAKQKLPSSLLSQASEISGT